MQTSAAVVSEYIEGVLKRVMVVVPLGLLGMAIGVTAAAWLDTRFEGHPSSL